MSLGSSTTAGAGFLVGTAKPTGFAESDILLEMVLDSESIIRELSCTYELQKFIPGIGR